MGFVGSSCKWEGARIKSC